MLPMKKEELIKFYELYKNNHICLYSWPECGPGEITLKDFLELIKLSVKGKLCDQ